MDYTLAENLDLSTIITYVSSNKISITHHDAHQLTAIKLLKNMNTHNIDQY